MFSKRIMDMDFGKAAKHLAVAALVAVLVGGTLSGCMLMPQITEAVAWSRTAANHEAEHDADVAEPNANEQENLLEDATSLQSKEQHWDRDDGEFPFLGSPQFTEPSLLAKITVTAFAAVCAFLGFAYWALVAAWLYKAASLADMGGTLWALLGLLANIPAVLFFLAVRSVTRAKCEKCGHWQVKDSFCRFCGTRFSRVCERCGCTTEADGAFCSHCGKALSDGDDK